MSYADRKQLARTLADGWCTVIYKLTRAKASTNYTEVSSPQLALCIEGYISVLQVYWRWCVRLLFAATSNGSGALAITDEIGLASCNRLDGRAPSGL